MRIEFGTDITLETLIKLNEEFGVTVELNDGQITGVIFPDQKVQKTV